MKTVGILGGMGPVATEELYRRIRLWDKLFLNPDKEQIVEKTNSQHRHTLPVFPLLVDDSTKSSFVRGESRLAKVPLKISFQVCDGGCNNSLYYPGPLNSNF